MDTPENTLGNRIRITNMFKMARPEKTVRISMEGLSDVLYTYSDSTIHIDPNGDLDLLVGTEKELRTFRVSSAMLLRASPVWRSMLTRGFKESDPTSSSITFPEDDVLTFFVVLLAVHLRFSEVPCAISSRQFAKICVFGDKYDCFGVVQPWFERWKAELNLVGSSDNLFMEDREVWTWIAWTIGDQTLVSRFIKYYILYSHNDEAMQLYDTHSRLLDGNLPIALIGM